MRKRVTDRRRLGPARSFPLTDQSGCVIPFNRSYTPDRRLQSYQVSEIDTEEFCLGCMEPLFESV